MARTIRCLPLLLALTGCNLVLGMDPVEREPSDGSDGGASGQSIVITPDDRPCDDRFAGYDDRIEEKPAGNCRWDGPYQGWCCWAD